MSSALWSAILLSALLAPVFTVSGFSINIPSAHSTISTTALSLPPISSEAVEMVSLLGVGVYQTSLTSFCLN